MGIHENHLRKGAERVGGAGNVGPHLDRKPRSGDILRITRAASVQFTSPMLYRVIRVHDWPTYEGWVWLDGYELNHVGEAVERRSIFVQLDGLQWAREIPRRQRNARRTT